MTSKLKCPVCGKDLIPMTLSSNDNGTLYSSVAFPIKDCICNTSASKKIWQALIQAKQDLEIATKALEDIKSDYELYSEQGCRMEPNETDMYNYARTALEQINHFADVSKMIEHKE